MASATAAFFDESVPRVLNDAEDKWDPSELTTLIACALLLVSLGYFAAIQFTK